MLFWISSSAAPWAIAAVAVCVALLGAALVASGAFGGKETQANHTAIWCSLLAQATASTRSIMAANVVILLASYF